MGAEFDCRWCHRVFRSLGRGAAWHSRAQGHLRFSHNIQSKGSSRLNSRCMSHPRHNASTQSCPDAALRHTAVARSTADQHRGSAQLQDADNSAGIPRKLSTPLAFCCAMDFGAPREGPPGMRRRPLGLTRTVHHALHGLFISSCVGSTVCSITEVISQRSSAREYGYVCSWATYMKSSDRSTPPSDE